MKAPRVIDGKIGYELLGAAKGAALHRAVMNDLCQAALTWTTESFMAPEHGSACPRKGRGN